MSGNLPIVAREFRDRLEAEFGSVCPFCGIRMQAPSLLAHKQGHSPWTRTKAHLESRLRGRRVDNGFIYACHKCNGDQGHLTLDEWLCVLVYRDDQRRQAVREIVIRSIRLGLLTPGRLLSEVMAEENAA